MDSVNPYELFFDSCFFHIPHVILDHGLAEPMLNDDLNVPTLQPTDVMTYDLQQKVTSKKPQIFEIETEIRWYDVVLEMLVFTLLLHGG